jgi:phosphoribosylformylglycinamidine synthase
MNFGNPEHPEVMWQFSEAIDGMSAACTALDLPVVGGNVSFYNESRGRDIDPTPVVGVVGLIDELTDPPPVVCTAPGEHLLLLGPATAVEFGGSEWAFTVHGLDGGRPPAADLEAARAVHEVVRSLVVDRAVAGVHDCADGGLAVALAELAFGGATGFAVAVEPGIPAAAWCFAESASRVVVSVHPDRVADVVGRAGSAGVRAVDLGVAGGDRLVATGAFDVGLAEALATWRDAIPGLVEADVHV